MLITNYYRNNVILKNLLEISKLPNHIGLVYPSHVLWLRKWENVYLCLPPVLKKTMNSALLVTVETSLSGSLVSFSSFCKRPSVKLSHDPCSSQSHFLLDSSFFFSLPGGLLLHVHLAFAFTLFKGQPTSCSVNHRYKHAKDGQITSSADLEDFTRCIFDGEGSFLTT